MPAQPFPAAGHAPARPTPPGGPRLRPRASGQAGDLTLEFQPQQKEDQRHSGTPSLVRSHTPVWGSAVGAQVGPLSVWSNSFSFFGSLFPTWKNSDSTQALGPGAARPLAFTAGGPPPATCLPPKGSDISRHLQGPACGNCWALQEHPHTLTCRCPRVGDPGMDDLRSLPVWGSAWPSQGAHPFPKSPLPLDLQTTLATHRPRWRQSGPAAPPSEGE